MPNIDMFHAMQNRGGKSYTPTANTVAYYKLDGNANDSSGNNNHGTATNVTYTTGQVNQAGSFNGSNGVIQSNITLGATITVSLRCKPTTAPSTTVYDKIFVIYTVGSPSLVVMDLSYGHVDPNYRQSISVRNTGNTYYPQKITGTLTGAWNHIVATFNGTTLSVYLNGVLNGSRSVAGSYGNSNICMLGKHPDLSYYYNGLIDEFVIENKVRTAQEVLNYYNTSK